MNALDGLLSRTSRPQIRRLNRLPVFMSMGIAVVLAVIIIWGLSVRGSGRDNVETLTSKGPLATDFAEELKRGVTDGVIAAPPIAKPEPSFKREDKGDTTASSNSQFRNQPNTKPDRPAPVPDSYANWRERLQTEHDEQEFRLAHQHRMARLQADDAAFDSPIAVDIGKVRQAPWSESQAPAAAHEKSDGYSAAADLRAAVLRAGGFGQSADPNKQAAKTDYFKSNSDKQGYLPNLVVTPRSPFELKRGSVIPATLVTGINSDLPGLITAQVSQNVYDSATGHRLLIPQGSKLFGKYDSDVSFGQKRVLVVWSDLIFPNGSTLQLAGMAGVDAEGYSGFRDQVDNRYLQTFGSALLIALIGTGIDMAIPQSSTSATRHTASDAARRNFADSFGRVAEQTVARNLDVQPTLKIRPGYAFNIIVEQDVVFPSAYR